VSALRRARPSRGPGWRPERYHRDPPDADAAARRRFGRPSRGRRRPGSAPRRAASADESPEGGAPARGTPPRAVPLTARSLAGARRAGDAGPHRVGPVEHHTCHGCSQRAACADGLCFTVVTFAGGGGAPSMRAWSTTWRYMAWDSLGATGRWCVFRTRSRGTAVSRQPSAALWSRGARRGRPALPAGEGGIDRGCERCSRPISGSRSTSLR
jgi:hypothetical protein